MKGNCTLGLLSIIFIFAVAVHAESPGQLPTTVPLSAGINSPGNDCWADGDVNNDGMVLTVADYVHLVRFCQGEAVGLPVPYKADLNGDCMVDNLDAKVYEDYFQYGLFVFAPYGGYPVPTCCDPDTIMGACCTTDRYERLNPANCQAAGGDYHGDGTLCDQYPGDANSDGLINIVDPVFLVNFFYKGGPPPDPPGNGDVNGDCRVDLDDVIDLVCHFPGKQFLPVICTCPDPIMGEPRNCMPGDANNDGTVNIADAIFLISMIFGAGPQPAPFTTLSGDPNGDAIVNLGDVVFLIAYVFKDGPAPPTCFEWIWNWPCVHPEGFHID